MTVKELKEIAKERKIKNYSKMNKAELEEVIKALDVAENFYTNLDDDVELIQYKNNDEWLETRKLGIGGSDIAAVLGASRYKSPVDVWHEKLYETNFEGNNYTYWGNKLEGLIADEFSFKHSEFEVKEINKTLKRGHSLANIDRLLMDIETEEYGVLEIKTANAFKVKEWDGEEIPQEYYAQVMHYLAVTGLSFAFIAVLIGGNDFKEFYIERNEEEVKLILNSVEEFWNDYVLTETPPPADGSTAYSEYQKKKLYKLDGKIEVEIDGLDEKLDEYDSIGNQMKELEKRQELIKQQITDELIKKEGTLAKGEKHKITIVTQNRSSIDKKALIEKHPEYAEIEEQFKVLRPVKFIKIS